MSTLSQFFAGGTSFANEMVFISSRTFVTPVKGTYLLTAIGGGGSGGAANASGLSSGYIAGAGGGAGGFCQSLVKLNAGVTLTLTVGSGGTGVAVGSTAGNSGGASSIAGAGITTLLASGGAGGQGGIVSTSTRLGGNGGTASGGNLLNVTGQAGQNTTGSTVALSGAGGSVGLFGYTPTGTNGALEASVYTTLSAHISNYDAASGVSHINSIQPYYGRYLDPKGQIQGYVKVGSSNIVRRFGLSYMEGASGNVTSSSVSGEFSGGGATTGWTSQGDYCTGGGGGGGGGSGAGLATTTGTYSTSTSGAGGAGRCVIEWAPDA